MEKSTKICAKPMSLEKILSFVEEEDDPDLCTEYICVDDDDNMRIECHKCQRRVHYACTGLPSYQLNLFLNKGYRKYVCITCCLPPKELNRKIHEQAERIKSCTHSRKEIKACENIIHQKSENEKKLNSTVKDLQARCRDYLKEKTRVTDLIESQFTVLETKLTAKIEEAMVNTALQHNAAKESKKSFAEATKSNGQLDFKNMKQLLRSERVEEQIEEQRKQSIDANIIIHGVKENTNKDDNNFVNELLNDVNIKTQPTYISRVGKESNDVRPIKVAFKDSHIKYRFMRRLTELKQHDKYSKISITDDLTKMEREQIKEWKRKADERNKAMSNQDFQWRVRGSPREKLYLKKISCKRLV